MNKKLISTLALLTFLTLPAFAGAVDLIGIPDVINDIDVEDLVELVLEFVWPVFIGFAIIMFIVAGFYFFTAKGEPERVAQAGKFVMWGVVGMAIGILAFSIPLFIKTQLGA